MHHHRRSSSTLGLKFAVSSKLKEEAEEEDMEEEEDEDEEEVEGFEEDEGETEEVEEFKEEGRDIHEELIQLKKKRIDLDSGIMSAGNKKSKTATVAAGSGSGGCSGAPPFICKVEKCRADLTDSKKYHKRHRVCECHAKAQVAIVDGLKQRFCQQCSRFHELSEFDDTKRSCRRRLEGHNARRRKSSMESHGVGIDHGGSGLAAKKDQQCRLVQERGRGQMVFPKNHRNLHIHS